VSLEAILAAIETWGENEAACRRAEAESRARQILDEASRKAQARREEARRAALWPVSTHDGCTRPSWRRCRS
jgi:vacuolar-type H+-ATPase subunit E/Vma4